MKSRIVACAVVLTFLGLKAAAQESTEAGTKQGASRAGVNQQITEMERKLRDAALKNDVSFFEEAMADDYVGIGSVGKIYGKAGNIRARKSRDLKFESIDYSDQKIRVYGNTAIVTGTVNVKGSFKAHDFSGTYVYTRVYVRKGRSWKVVNFQVTKVLPPQSKGRGPGEPAKSKEPI